MLMSTAPNSLGAQEAAAHPGATVLFVCEHGTVRSLLAKVATAAAGAARAHWDSLPSVRRGYATGRDAIKARVHQLVDSLKARSRTRKTLAPAAEWRMANQAHHGRVFALPGPRRTRAAARHGAIG